MSSVRMCDAKRSPACEGIFSELSEDWSTMTGSKFGTDKDTGRRISVSVEMDVCGACNRNDAPGATPAMLHAGDKGQPTLFGTIPE